MDIVEFLRARLREDEAQAQRSKADNAMNPNLRIPAGWINGVADRVLREVEAKRRIVDQAEELRGFVMAYRSPRWTDDMNEQDKREWHKAEARNAVSDATLRALAAVYADHPDYDPAWAEG